MGAFAEISEDLSCVCDITAHDLARTHVSYYYNDAKRAKGMYRQRTQKAWGHTAHRGWARLLLDRSRDLIFHGLAHRGANGAAIPTDEDDQDGQLFYNHPERGGLLCCLGARSHCYCCLDPIPQLRGGGNNARDVLFSLALLWSAFLSEQAVCPVVSLGHFLGDLRPVPEGNSSRR